MGVLDRYRAKIRGIAYTFEHWHDYDYTILGAIRKCKELGHTEKYYNDVIIMGDTETAKKDPCKVHHNHVVAWTISIRACSHNICTLYGHKPDTMIDCIDKILESLHEDAITFMYFHNLPYDYVFLRQFMYKKWGYPEKQLNIKPHYPLFLTFDNKLIIKDSLILAQRSLDKWAKDLNVEHQKATGKWDYDKIRGQQEEFTPEELEYIEHDTLAGVECLDATMTTLNKHIYSMPYTATGIPREQVRKASRQNRAHDKFLNMALTWDQLQEAEKAYHGGYTHANRHYLNSTVSGNIASCDFASSYPYEMLTRKVPIGKFFSVRNCSMSEILEQNDKYAFIFHFIAAGVKIKSDHIVMPTLQISKCDKSVNTTLDNGRILSADYLSIYLNDLDLELIRDQYDIEKHICIEVICAKKGLLPKWFRDIVYQIFKEKTTFKGGDPVLYEITKAKLNSLYGLCVQHPVQAEIIEEYTTGEFYTEDAEQLEEKYNKWVNRYTSILPYQWGIYITSGAMLSLHELGKLCNTWLYSDTDSVYGTGWNLKGLEHYNATRKARLKDCGYDGVLHNGKVYYLGVAEHDPEEDVYTEFRTVGAKRYCYRKKSDGELHITVAGVPKKNGAKCLNNDINNFTDGLIFSGEITGKKTHTYFFNDIYTDDKGNITGDSIDLSSCDYMLSSEQEINWNDILYDTVEVQNYEIL